MSPYGFSEGNLGLRIWFIGGVRFPAKYRMKASPTAMLSLARAWQKGRGSNAKIGQAVFRARGPRSFEGPWSVLGNPRIRKALIAREKAGHPMTERREQFEYDDLLACARGELFGPGNAQLPLPPMLMFDRISEVDRKSTRLNSSHLGISYAVFCLK